MIISYRDDVGEKVASQVEMAIHAKPLIEQLHVPWYRLNHVEEADRVDGILKHSFMCRKPVAVFAAARFWKNAK